MSMIYFKEIWRLVPRPRNMVGFLSRILQVNLPNHLILMHSYTSAMLLGEKSKPEDSQVFS